MDEFILKNNFNPRLRSPRLNASPVYMPTNGLSRCSSLDAYVLYPPPRDTCRMPRFYKNKRSIFGCANCDYCQSIKFMLSKQAIRGFT